MQSQLQPRLQLQGTRLNWLPQRSCVQRRSLRVDATSGAAPPPPAGKELSNDMVTRQYRRTVYDFSLWAKHRDVNRYLYNLKTIPGSRIIRTLGQPMGIVLAWAAMFGFYETCLESGVLPSYFPKLTLMSAEPQGLTSFALSLLLVFRTNSSYGRFDEARKIWGGILNRARNIANQAVTFIPAEDVAGREAVGKWAVGFCRALQAHLQEDANLREELQKAQPRWSREEIDMLCSAQHSWQQLQSCVNAFWPIKAISMLSELTRQLPISQFQALQMQENVTFFYDALGGCERLLRTPIPVSYTRILPLDAICTRAQTDVVSLLKDDPAVVKYISDVRQGRIAPPTEPPVAGAAPVAAAPPPPPPASAGGGISRSGSPTAQQQPDVMKTVTSMLHNVKAGIGAVAPAPPRPPSPQPRARSPRAASPGGPSPFPRASAGTGGAAAAVPSPPPIKPLTSSSSSSSGAVSKDSNNSTATAKKPASAPAASSAGFSMGFSGLADGAAAAAKSASAAAAKFSKIADSVVAGTPAAPASEAKRETAAAAAMQAQPRNTPSSSSSTPSAAPANGSSDDDRSSSGRRTAAAVNWREELAALRAGREDAEEPASASASYDREFPSSSWSFSSASSAAVVQSGDAEDEARRRFGGLAGRGARSDTTTSAAAVMRGNGNGLSENGYGNGYGNDNGNGNGNTVEARGARPRTRPDWRNQL
ncbi:hypothetical protein VOLCADRAFT_102778 [Volvox carteri f. nagariensis]|uniref:Uncharacterized protein n=1 Tax=Volvox carteri f. nagariensis TaxID=3068 RepID=D8TI01_VOLCA|nr:uncharacterized protein VOLCADRAFT_102778 [Volvox carteri f. nagariensis]EFJ52805.1 hypothetical protein VOLCADRAFT_102778 [Volvox carteri f. nagariensis]|eukprot:XP_002945810.1 hypothetical protein VOLCADRAFT_102778 [Volvox carteri f. nagariensis]